MAKCYAEAARGSGTTNSSRTNMTPTEKLPKIEYWAEPPKMDTGSPRPELYFSNDLYCTYYLPDFVVLRERKGCRFALRGSTSFPIGHPNAEALHGHPLHKYRLEQYDFFLVSH